MSKLSKSLHGIIEVRSKRRRWVYVLCCVVVLLFALFAAAMGGIVGDIVYLPIIAICLLQFLRPTILGWFLLTVIFLGYAVGVAMQWRDLSRIDFMVFLLIGLVPALALLWSWPRALAER